LDHCHILVWIHNYLVHQHEDNSVTYYYESSCVS